MQVPSFWQLMIGSMLVSGFMADLVAQIQSRRPFHWQWLHRNGRCLGRRIEEHEQRVRSPRPPTQRLRSLVYIWALKGLLHHNLGVYAYYMHLWTQTVTMDRLPAPSSAFLLVIKPRSAGPEKTPNTGIRKSDSGLKMRESVLPRPSNSPPFCSKYNHWYHQIRATRF